jgi:3-mercaptopyruvate sulfurtransferase SseA
MLHDEWDGKGLADPEFRKMFTRESLLASDWYAARLAAKQKIDRQLWLRHVDYLDKFLKRASHADEAARLGIAAKLERAKKTLAEVESPDYVKQLVGTLGAEPIANWPS